jgi:hypothetical protein
MRNGQNTSPPDSFMLHRTPVGVIPDKALRRLHGANVVQDGFALRSDASFLRIPVRNAFRGHRLVRRSAAALIIQLVICIGPQLAGLPIDKMQLERQKSTGLFNRSRSWLLYSAFAEAFLAQDRFWGRLRRLLHLLQPCAITAGANSFGQNFTLFLHKRPIIKMRQKVESI